MKIGIDIDGVIADFVSSFLPLINKYCECKIEDIINYDFGKNINIKDSENEKLWREVEKKNIYKELALIKGSKSALKKLVGKNEVVIISSRKQKAEIETLKWLKRHGMPFKKLELASNIKEKVAKMSTCDIVIEDSLEIARMVGSKGVPVLLFDYPWNKIGKNIKRIKDWGQALQQIKKERGKRKINGRQRNKRGL